MRTFWITRASHVKRTFFYFSFHVQLRGNYMKRFFALLLPIASWSFFCAPVKTTSKGCPSGHRNWHPPKAYPHAITNNPKETAAKLSLRWWSSLMLLKVRPFQASSSLPRPRPCGNDPNAGNGFDLHFSVSSSRSFWPMEKKQDSKGKHGENAETSINSYCQGHRGLNEPALGKKKGIWDWDKRNEGRYGKRKKPKIRGSSWKIENITHRRAWPSPSDERRDQERLSGLPLREDNGWL